MKVLFEQVGAGYVCQGMDMSVLIPARAENYLFFCL